MDLKELWQTTLTEIELTTSKANYITWFKNTDIHAKKEGTVIINTPNGFTKEWLENKYNKLILKILRNHSPDVKDVQFVIGKSSFSPKENEYKKEKEENFLNDQQLGFQEFNLNKETNLNPKYNFDNFIVGSFNELAQAAGRAVVKHAGTLYNPLFVYGGVGLGKTHLLQAIGNELTKKHPNKKIKYLSSEKYTTELVDAISKRGMESFKDKYHKTDVLIIDDIQFIAGKEKTQEEFFHTFNSLYQKNKQIIISSDRPPNAIATLEDRLRSRFEGGMIADVSTPDLETRFAILKNKAQEKKVKIPDESINYIVTHIQKSIRDLEGALNRVVAFSQINNTTPTLKNTAKILSQIIKTPKKMTNHKNIIQTVAEFYDIAISDLTSHSRKKELVRPRQITMHLLREELKGSYPFIGEKLGGRDHTTVIYACQKINKEIEENDSLQQEINLIKERLYN